MKFPLIVSLSALLLAGCITYPETARVNASLAYSEYNPATKSDVTTPLTVEVGGDILYVKLFSHPLKRTQVMIDRSKAGEFIAAIDKYLSWEKLARERGDQLSKKIGSVSFGGANYVIRFYTAAGDKHYLLMGVRSKVLGDGPIEPDIYDLSFDRENAEKLKSIIESFSGNRLSQEDKSQIYK